MEVITIFVYSFSELFPVTNLLSSFRDYLHREVQRTDRELCHTVQQSPEAPYQQNHQACVELQCFKYGCRCKEATNSKT